MSSYDAPVGLVQAFDALPGDRWSAETRSDGVYAVAMRTASTVTWLTLLHDGAPAPRGDVEFVAGAREDVQTLTEYLQDGRVVDVGQLQRIRARFEKATPGKWVHYLESAGGLGGSSVITMTESEADLYLLVEGRPAPDPVWTFVGLVHEEMPTMLAAVVA